MELDSWQLQGFSTTSLKLRGASDESGLSPHIAVFTTFLPDHQNYYKNDMDKYFSDKVPIFTGGKEKTIVLLRDRKYQGL